GKGEEQVSVTFVPPWSVTLAIPVSPEAWSLEVPLKPSTPATIAFSAEQRGALPSPACHARLSMPKFLNPVWPPLAFAAMYSTREIPVSDRSPRKTALPLVLRAKDWLVPSRKEATRVALTESGVSDESAAPKAVT